MAWHLLSSSPPNPCNHVRVAIYISAGWAVGCIRSYLASYVCVVHTLCNVGVPLCNYIILYYTILYYTILYYTICSTIYTYCMLFTSIPVPLPFRIQLHLMQVSP